MQTVPLLDWTNESANCRRSRMRFVAREGFGYTDTCWRLPSSSIFHHDVAFEIDVVSLRAVSEPRADIGVPLTLALTIEDGSAQCVASLYA